MIDYLCFRSKLSKMPEPVSSSWADEIEDSDTTILPQSRLESVSFFLVLDFDADPALERNGSGSRSLKIY